MRSLRIIFFLSFWILSVIWFWVAISYELWTGNIPGAGFMPFVLGVTLFGLSGLLFFSQEGIRNRERGPMILPEGRRPLIWLALLLALSLLVMERIGFLLSMAFFVCLTLRVVEKWNWKRTVITSLFLPIPFWFLFDVLFQLGLPKGLLKFY